MADWNNIDLLLARYEESKGEGCVVLKLDKSL